MTAAARFAHDYNRRFPVGLAVEYQIHTRQGWLWVQSRTHSRARVRGGDAFVWVVGAPGKWWPLRCVRPLVGPQR